MVAMARQVTSSTADSPELIKKQTQAAVPLPDTLRLSAKGSKQTSAKATEGTDGGVSEEVKAASAAASTGDFASPSPSATKSSREGLEETREAIDEESAEETRRTPSRYGRKRWALGKWQKKRNMLAWCIYCRPRICTSEVYWTDVEICGFCRNTSRVVLKLQLSKRQAY